jgi:acyl-CoA synthetase (AMP-forming)/AMP-acid ligase II
MRRLRTLPEALVAAATTPHGITFVDRGAERTRTYADLLRSARSMASALSAAGLRRGDLVALVLTDAETFLTTLFGASMAGIVPALVYPPLTMVDLPEYFEATANVLRAAAVRAVVADAPLVDGFSALGASCPSLELVLAPPVPQGAALADAAAVSLDDLAMVQFTSGSTSAPKGVALTHRNIAANVAAVNGPAGLATTVDDVGVSWLPLYHDMGLVGMIIGSVYSRCAAVLLPPYAFVKRPIDWLRAMTRYHGTISFAPSFAYDLCVRRVKDRDLEGLDLSLWRVAGCGAEPIHPPTLDAFADRFASCGFRRERFVASYGLAEHVVAATLAPLGRAPRVDRLGSDDVVGCGRALADHEIKVVKEDGSIAPDGHLGEIILAGPSVMLGYYKQDVRTAETIRGGWLHTGDLGYLSDGELFVCGRAKDLIIANGRKYHPQDLEWAVGDLDGVRRGRVVAFGIQEPGRADRVVVLVETKASAPIHRLTDAVRRRVSDLFGLYVDDVACAPAGTITRTTSGKLQRAAAKSRYARGELVEVTHGSAR